MGHLRLRHQLLLWEGPKLFLDGVLPHQVIWGGLKATNLVISNLLLLQALLLLLLLLLAVVIVKMYPGQCISRRHLQGSRHHR
jgi:hypothetical protein